MKTGDQLGRWRLVRQLGRGGNADVWAAATENGSQRCAIKVLRPRRRDRLARFRTEANFHSHYPDFPGVLPLLEADLPDDPTKPAWYAMPVATPLREALGVDPGVDVVLDAVARVAETLAALATLGVGHRDVKPDNLFELDGAWLVGDFGLVEYPEKEALTEQGRRLGPIDYMAPEMRANADTASAEPADVYSLAKSLWVLLTGVELPLPGPHRVDDPAYSIQSRVMHPRAPELDRLIELGTRNGPGERPSMTEFAHELRACLQEPPERADTSDRTALTDRIAALTAAGERREDEASRYRQLFDAAFALLRDEALSPPYHELARALPGFRSSYRDGKVALAELLPPVRAMYGEHGWAGHLVARGQRLPISATVAVGLRLHESGAADLVGMLVVDRPHPVEPDRYFITRVVESAPLGSGQLVVAIDRIRAGFEGGIDAALQQVASLLAERDG